MVFQSPTPRLLAAAILEHSSGPSSSSLDGGGADALLSLLLGGGGSSGNNAAAAETDASSSSSHLENAAIRNPYHLPTWLALLQAKGKAGPVVRYLIYERALRFLPRSYKLWRAYLAELGGRLETRSVVDGRNAFLVNAYERALVHMHKMPTIWLMYCRTLMRLGKFTDTRRAFDRALQSLPVTQHAQVWDLYLQWARGEATGTASPPAPPKETAIRVYRRFLMFDPSQREEFVAYLEGAGMYEEAATQLALCVNDESFVSSKGATRHQLWIRLCEMCANHPEEISRSVKVDAVIRTGIARFSDEVGRLWCRLADYYTRLGQLERARDVYEEAVKAVVTVRDFTLIFDAYAKFEESILTAKMQLMQQTETDGEDVGQDGQQGGALFADVELRMGRLEHLMEQRPLWLSSVILRQNPNNVHEWHKRAKILMGQDGTSRESRQELAADPSKLQAVLLCYMEAVRTVDPRKAHGRLSGLWLAMARTYESNGDMGNARAVLRKATQVNYKSVEELAGVWCAWAEMEMKHECYENALAVMREAVAEPAAVSSRRMRGGRGGEEDDDKADGSGVTGDRVYKSTQAWGLYLDLEESLGTVETCRAAYQRVMDLKIITPKMCLNYAAFLEENNFFEDSFRVYESAVLLFSFPHVKPIWLTYLDKFIARYEGSKLERLRDLFEQAISAIPTDDAAEFYIKYAKSEESFGMARHAMAVYDRATRAVPESRRLDMYRLYIVKVEQYYGITKTRPVYERAISELDDEGTKALCLEFAAMERRLGEVDRARAIYAHGSQLADPKRDNLGYWAKWREFEEAHGNEDTFRDMLRIQRSVQTAFSQVSYTATEMLQQFSSASADAGTAAGGMSAMEAVAAEQRSVEAASHKRKFVPSSSTVASISSSSAGVGTTEIDIDDDVAAAADASAPKRRAVGSALDEDDFDTPAQRSVPAAVFGGLKSSE